MKFLFDFFPILLFFIAYKLYGIYPATAVAILASLVQVAAFWIKHRRFENMHLITLGLIVVLGGATLLFQNKAFFMWKPTAVNWLFALGFLTSQLIGEKTLVERMMSHAITAPKNVWQKLNISWILFFIVMGLLNIYVASFFFEAEHLLLTSAGIEVDLENCANQVNGQLLALCNNAKTAEETWVNFKLFGMMGLTILFVIGQAFYLARYMNEDKLATENEAGNKS